MDFSELLNQDIITGLFLVIDFILSIVALKKKGKTITTSDVVQSDLEALIKYHESTLEKLKSFKK